LRPREASREAYALPDPHGRAMGAVLAAVLLPALLLRCDRLSSENHGDDELFSASWATQLSLSELFTLRINPLCELILRVISLGGCLASYPLLRGWGIACGMAGIYCLYRLGQGLGVAAAVLLTASAFHVFYCQETRLAALHQLPGRLDYDVSLPLRHCRIGIPFEMSAARSPRAFNCGNDEGELSAAFDYVEPTP